MDLEGDPESINRGSINTPGQTGSEETTAGVFQIKLASSLRKGNDRRKAQSGQTWSSFSTDIWALGEGLLETGSMRCGLFVSLSFFFFFFS